MYHSHSSASLLLILLLIGVPSCSSTPVSERGPQQNRTDRVAPRTVPDPGTRYLTAVAMPEVGPVTLPDWVVNPTIDGVLGAVGVAGTNQLGTGEQVDSARTSARMEIARMLEIRLQDIGRRDVEQYLQVGNGGELRDQGSRKSLLGVDRDITDVVLAGSRQRALWFDPANGDCYVWIVMDGGVKTKADHYVENGVSVYVANQVISNEFRPEHPKAEAPAAPPAPVQAPEPVKGPVEQLESRLKPIESIPIKTEDKK